MDCDPNLINALEPSQLSEATRRALPRRKLGRRTVAVLIALLVYVLITVSIVGSAFIHAVTARAP
ncbi:MAG TPA: hypothetical protein VKV96_00205 [Roseiarcus sp.]|nr:hypothetical protein [Roseiarcus sp.]